MQRRFHIFQFTSMSRSDTSKQRKRILGRIESEMSFVEDSYSKSMSGPKPQDALELSDSGVGSGYQNPEISCTGATYGSEVIAGIEVQKGKKIIGTEGRPDFNRDLRLEHKSNFSVQTRNVAGNYGATRREKGKFHYHNNNNRYEPEPDY